MISPFEGDAIRSGEHIGVESARVQADPREESAVEHYAGLCEEALSHHPPKWNSCKSVAGVTPDRSAADV